MDNLDNLNNLDNVNNTSNMDKMDNAASKEKDLKDRVAYLESINDQLYTELTQIDHLMRRVGFTEGINTVRETAKILKSELSNNPDNPEDDIGDSSEVE